MQVGGGRKALRYGAAMVATCALALTAGVTSAAAGGVGVQHFSDGSYFTYSALLGVAGVGGETNRVELKAAGGSPGFPTRITVKERGGIIDPAGALASGCKVHNLHAVTCESPTYFELGFVIVGNHDDRVTITEDSQPMKYWQIWCGDGEDTVRAIVDEHIDPIDCETVEAP